MSTNELEDAAQLEILLRGEIAIVMRMPYSSNATYLVSVTLDDKSVQAIYKPMRGEKPLWDFEPGLHRREVQGQRRLNWFRRLLLETEGQCFGNEVPKFVRNLR